MSLSTYLIIILIFSLITFYSYYIDKSRKTKNQWRIPQKSLIMMSFLFGSIGGIISIYTLGFKEKKIIFLNYLALLFQLVLGVFIYITFGF